MKKTSVTIELSADTVRILTAEAKLAGGTLEKTIELHLAMWAGGEEAKQNQPPVIAPRHCKDMRLGTVFGPEKEKNRNLPLTSEEQKRECFDRDRR